MNLLAIDTATETCSAALISAERVTSQFEICPQQHSQRLLPMVDELLQSAGTVLSDLDGFVFGRGPGSFTGVRIATGMLQGLALGAGKPVVGISTLAAMAQQAIEQHNADKIVVAIDARMSEVYFAVFDNVDGLATPVGEEQVCSPEIAVSLCPEGAFVFAGTGWEAYPELAAIAQNQTNSTILYPDARFMLSLAIPVFERGEAVAVDEIQPVYLRDKVTWKKLPGRE